jgi:ubiquinone/menaquinone biosynthesis C-methylase UbiE
MENMPERADITEIERLRAVYAERDSSGKKALYQWNLRANALVDYRRRDAWIRAFNKTGMTDLGSARILDVGCGTAGWLRNLLEWGARPELLHGVDALTDRILHAKSISHPDMDFQVASAQHMPFPDQCFDLVAASTVFSSVLDPQQRANLGREMLRVARKGGVIMVYDYVISDPRNPNTVGIGANEIKRIFEGASLAHAFRLTLLPPLARRFPEGLLWLAHMIEVVLPFLCGHRLYVLEKLETVLK